MGKRSREKQEKRELGIPTEQPEVSTVKILKKIIFIGTCFILFTPFIISSKYFFPFVGLKSIYFMALAEIIFAAWLILIISSPKYRPQLNVLLFILALFLLVQILSSVFGVDFTRSFWSKYERMTGLLMQFHLFAFFLVVSSVFRRKEEWLKIFGVSVFTAVLMSLIALLLQVDINLLGDLASATRAGATLGNSSFLGTYLLFNFFFALYLFFNSKGVVKIFSASAAIFIISGLIFSTARAASAATLGGIILLALLWLIFAKSGKFRISGILISAFLVVVLVVTVFFMLKPGNVLHTEIYERFIGDTFGGRFPVWLSGWQGFLDKPAFGWGPENFEIVFTHYFNPCLLGPNCGGDIWYDRAHNVIFDTLATLGMIGFLSYLGIFVAVFYVLWKKFARKVVGFWTAGIFSVVLIVYFIQNLTVFDMVNSYMLFFLVLGFVGSVAQVKDEVSGQQSPGKDKPIKLLTTVLILIVLIFPFTRFIIQPLRADRSIIVSLGLPVGSPARVEAYEKTLEESPLGNYQIRDFFTQETLGIVQSSGNLTEAQVKSVKGEFDFLAQELEKSINKSPWDFRSHLKLGQLYNTYAILLDPVKLYRAEEVLSAAIVASPANQQGYWGLAQTKIYQGQTQEALSLVEKALELEPMSRQSNLIVIQIAKIIGDEDLLQQKITQALENNPELEEEIKNLVGG